MPSRQTIGHPLQAGRPSRRRPPAGAAGKGEVGNVRVDLRRRDRAALQERPTLDRPDGVVTGERTFRWLRGEPEGSRCAGDGGVSARPEQRRGLSGLLRVPALDGAVAGDDPADRCRERLVRGRLLPRRGVEGKEEGIVGLCGKSRRGCAEITPRRRSRSRSGIGARCARYPARTPRCSIRSASGRRREVKREPGREFASPTAFQDRQQRRYGLLLTICPATAERVSDALSDAAPVIRMPFFSAARGTSRANVSP